MQDRLKATYSEWDTDVFGFRVGLLTATDPIMTHAIKGSNREFDVVFVKVPGWHEPKSAMWCVDWQYDMEVLHPPHKVVGEPQVMKLNAPMASHLEIASAVFSKTTRFVNDPALSPNIGKFYRKWLENKSELWVLGGQQMEDGFMLQGFDKDQIPRISLIGVAEKYRSLGLGERLILGAMNKLENAKAWRVKVSAKNWRALRFYEGLGFKVKSVATSFHVWTK